MEKAISKFWVRVENSTQMPADSLSVLRVFAGIFLLTIYSPFFYWIGEVPQAFFYPPLLSLTNLLSGFPPAWFFYFLDVAITIGLVLVTLGVKARFAGIATSLLMFIGYSFNFSFGKIDHNILVLAFLFLLSLSGWGEKFALVPDQVVSKSNQNKITSLLAIFLCFGMFSAGFLKAVVWIDFNPELNGFLRWYYSGLHGKGVDFFLINYLQELPLGWLDLVDYSGVIFELSPFILLLAGRSYWRLWLLATCVFHFANLLFLNIPFIPNFIIYMAFVNLEGLLPKLEKISKVESAKLIFILLISFLGLNRIFYSFEIEYSIFEVLKVTEVIMYIGFIIWVAGICIMGRETLKEFKISKESI